MCMGHQRGRTLNLSPALRACSVRAAERVMSSYDELVQEPMRPALSLSGQPFSARVFLNSGPTGWAQSGVKGPLTCGLSSERLMTMCWSYSHPASARRLALKPSAAAARPGRRVACFFLKFEKRRWVRMRSCT